MQEIDFWKLVLTILGSSLLGSIVGAAITLIGIWRQNIANAARLNQQIEAENARQKNEREMAIRREIYLGAIESSDQLQRYILSFADIAKSPEDRAKIIVNSSAPLSKLAAIAPVSLIRAWSQVEKHYSESVMKLASLSIDFKLRSDGLKYDEESHEVILQNMTQTTAELNAAIQANDIQSQNELIDRYEALKQLYEEQEGQLRERRKEMLEEIMSMMKQAIDATVKFSALTAPAYTIIREELGFSIDTEEYKKLVAAGVDHYRRLAEHWENDWVTKYKDAAEATPFRFDLNWSKD